MSALSRRGLLSLAAGGAAWGATKGKIREIRTRKHTLDKRDYLFVEIETEDGVTGIGEGSVSGRVDIVEQAIHYYRPYLVGREAAGIEEHWTRNYYELSRYRNGPVLMTALAAVDLALWDIEGKRLGQPVWRLLGASAAKPQKLYYSHWSQTLAPRTPERLEALARETKAAGWSCVKWVLPKGGTEAERLQRLVKEVEAVRRGGGEDFEFGLEMWETFSLRSALEFAKAVAPYRPMFIEEPTWRETPQALGELAAKVSVPLAGGEGLVSRYEFKQLLDAKGAMIVQPDVIHCGGITEIRKIAALAEVYGAEISPHMYYGPVAHVASLQSMMATRNFLMQEWDAGMVDAFGPLTKGTFPKVERGMATLSERPGLGVEMDWVEWQKRAPYVGASLRPPGGR